MVNPPPIDLSIPYLTEEHEGIGGKIRDLPEDFMVEEVALYEPSGHGNHLYVNLTKRNQTTRDVQGELAKLFKLRPQNIGTAGLKDKNGKEIYEFDKLYNPADREDYYVIEWNELEACWQLGEGGFPINKYQLSTFWEVIGNIYEGTE